MFKSENETPKIALSIAGSDNFGGAGIQADLKTFSALGCYGMSVVTAVTAQNSRGVHSVHSVPENLIEAQIQSILNDSQVNVVKVGMISSPSIVDVVGKFLKKFAFVVFDPVLFAKSGDKLVGDKTFKILHKLFPDVSVITPNKREAEELTSLCIDDEKTAEKACNLFEEKGVSTVVIKGYSKDSDSISDYFYQNGKGCSITRNYCDTRNLHGTGCTFSSAIASFIAHENNFKKAVYHARNYVQDAIKGAVKHKIGHGHGPIHHFVNTWPKLATNNFCEEAWEESQDIYEKIKHHPFNRKLSDGTLPQDIFIKFLQQDSLYLSDFSKAIALTATRLNDPKDSQEFLSFSYGAVEEENAIHKVYLKNYQNQCLEEKHKNPACLTYTSYLMFLAASQSVEESLAGLLPCPLVYQKISKYIQEIQIKPNPYQLWIDIYSDPEFFQNFDQRISFVNKYARQSNQETVMRMKMAFRRAMLMEHAFWNDVYYGHSFEISES